MPKKLFSAHDLFVVGLVLKAVESLTEIAAGLAAWFVSADVVVRTVALLTRGELIKDPNDFIANHLLSAANAFSISNHEFISLYLLAHGIVRLVLIIAIWYGKRWGYQLFMIALALFISYEVYRLILHPSFLIDALAAFDGIVLALAVQEYVGKYYLPTKNVL